MSKKQFHGFPLLLERGLQTQMKDKTIKIKPIPDEDSYYYGFASGLGQVFFTDNESAFRVGAIPLPINDKIKYWITIGLEFITDQSLKHISISIYTDNDSKTKLF